MADKGTVGSFAATNFYQLQGPRIRASYGQLSISGSARNDERPAAVTLHVFDVRLQQLMAVRSKASGVFAINNLAAGRYFVMVDGQQNYLPGMQAVDVS